MVTVQNMPNDVLRNLRVLILLRKKILTLNDDKQFVYPRSHLIIDSYGRNSCGTPDPVPDLLILISSISAPVPGNISRECLLGGSIGNASREREHRDCV